MATTTTKFQMSYASGGADFFVIKPDGNTTTPVNVNLPMTFHFEGQDYLALSNTLSTPEMIYAVNTVQFFIA